MADTVSILPELWAKIATFTRSKRGISNTGQICRASRQGVAKSHRPWRTLEKKYGIQRCEDPTQVRETTIRFLEEQEVVKHRFLDFASPPATEAPPRPIFLLILEGIMDNVMTDRDVYHTCLAALQRDDSTDVFFRSIKVPSPRTRSSSVGTLTARALMGCLCAAYAAVCMPMAILLVIKDEPHEYISVDTPAEALNCLRIFLENFTNKDEDLAPDWLVGWDSIHDDITKGVSVLLRLRNSSTIFVTSMDDTFPALWKYDGIVVCEQSNGPNMFIISQLHLVTTRHRVHFG